MPITQGTAAIALLRIADKTVLKKISLDSLKHHAIRQLEGAEEKTAGFAPISEPFSARWSSHPEIGEFLAFALRMDSKRIPGPVLKKHMQEALEKEAEKNQEEGKTFVSRARKKEIKEQVKARLLTKADAVPAVHEIAINQQTGFVYLGSSSNAVIKTAQEIFLACFGCELVEIQQEFSIEDQDKVTDFLTQAVTQGIKTDAGSIVATGQITVADSDKQISGSSRTDDEIKEIYAAIEAGMKVSKTGIRVDLQDGESCTLSITPLLRISGMKLPATQPQNDTEDPDALFLERMFLIEKYTSFLLNAFTDFAKAA